MTNKKNFLPKEISLITKYVDYRIHQSIIMTSCYKSNINVLNDKHMNHIIGKNFNIEILKYFNYNNYKNQSLLMLLDYNNAIPIKKCDIIVIIFGA